jgi:hypothetical protein
MEVLFNVVDSADVIQCSIRGDLLRTAQFQEVCHKICAERIALSVNRNYTNLVINLTDLGKIDDGKLHKLIKENITQLSLSPLFKNLFILAENRDKMFRKMVEYNINYYVNQNPEFKGKVLFFEKEKELSERIAFSVLKDFYMGLYIDGSADNLSFEGESTLEFQARISAMLEVVGPI